MNKKNTNFNNEVHLPRGISDFKKLIQGDYTFVDKTLFVKDIIDNRSDEVIVITRPRRFGKTLNLSMLYHFLQQNNDCDENIFEDLEISKATDFCQKHQNQYPVIFISFKDIKQANYDEAYANIVVLIKRLYDQYTYLLEGDLLSESQKETFIKLLKGQGNSADIIESIKQLSVYLTKKFSIKPIILIDEYDTPIQEAYLRDYYEDMIDFIRSLFGKALKDNEYLSKAVLTGITRVAQESLFSGVNNLGVYSILIRRYGEYFGFTENEVKKLISETKRPVSIDAIKEWYNGYQIYQYILYNPWSIISCLINEGELKPYWVNTSSNALIAILLSDASLAVKHNFEKLLQKRPIKRPLFENLVFTDIKTTEEALWGLLLSAGYLKVLSAKFDEKQGLVAEIMIPNKEVYFVYDTIIKQWFSKAISTDSYNKFVLSLSVGDLDKFKMYLSSYIMQSGSYFDFNQNTPEQIFHVFILGLVVGLRDHYYIYSNRESGIGRFDVILIPHDKQKRGILLEFKTASNDSDLQNKAKEALDQIKDQQYFEEFKQHKVNKILAIGLAFFSKQVELVYENINLR